MSLRRLARALALVLDLVVLTASGVYLIVYLYRWEWNRAVVSGIFFLIAQVALVAMVLVRRVADLERRLASAEGPPPIPADAWLAERSPGRPFPWLEPVEPVFVPVLIGVGAILSAVAYAVEHLAAATSPASRGSIDARLARLEPPSGGLAEPSSLGWDEPLGAAGSPRLHEHVASAVVVLLALALLVVASVNTIAGLTRNRPDPHVEGSATTFEVAVSVRDADVSASRVADALWVSCRANVPDEVDATIASGPGSSVRLRLEPAIGHNARRRFVGCLQDLTVEGALAHVTAWRAVIAG
jgi:hypothetical protein